MNFSHLLMGPKLCWGLYYLLL